MEKAVFSNFWQKAKVVLEKAGDIIARAVEEPLPQNATARDIGILIKNTFSFIEVSAQDLELTQCPAVVVVPSEELTQDEFAERLSRRLRREGLRLEAETETVYKVVDSKKSYTVYFAKNPIAREVVKHLPHLVKIF